MNKHEMKLVSSKEPAVLGYSVPQYVRKPFKVVKAGFDAREGEKTRIILEFKKNNPKYADLDILAFINKDFFLKRCKPWGIEQLLNWSEHKKLHPYTVLSQYSKQCEIFSNSIICREGE